MVDSELEQNTEATQDNTRATQEASRGNGDIGRLTVTVAALLLSATCFVSYINKEFATQQAGIIFSAVAGGVFGATTAKR